MEHRDELVVELEQALAAGTAAVWEQRLNRAGVMEDAVAHLGGEVEPAPVALELLDDAQRVLVVAEAAPTARAQQLVERVLARVPERRVADVVAEPDRLDEILVQA